jgi:hypothetical protein
MTLRAKFVVTSITKTQMPGSSITLTPQYDLSIAEDQRFAKATPSGQLTLFCDNPAAEAFLRMGKTYYLDLTSIG